jgi:hypothetical protein
VAQEPALWGPVKKNGWSVVLQGPAHLAWQAQALSLPHMQVHSELNSALAGAHCVLTGTGWASTLEHDARKLAISNHIPCIAVIDHWVNYAERFERDKVMVLPDHIWVSDHYAEDLAKDLFKYTPVLTMPNLYLSNLVKKIPPVPNDCCNLLYVLEPVRNDWGRGVPGEFQALDYFVQHLAHMVGSQPAQIILRPHPSDPLGKYSAWIQANSSLDIRLDSQMDLNDSIAQARWVVGVESFALVVANAAGRETFSSLPPWAHRFRLPLFIKNISLK